MVDIAPAVSTIAGIEDNMTSVRSHPLKRAITKPPMNVASNCMNFPTCNKGTKESYKVMLLLTHLDHEATI